MMIRSSATILCALAVAVSFGCAHAPPSPDQLRAPSLGAPTPDSLASLFVHRFAADSPAAFDSVDPDSESRTVMHGAIKRTLAREAGLDRVVWRNSNRAVLLLTGTVKADNGGDETNLVRHLSGLYEADEHLGTWSIARQLPIDTLNYIHAQALHVELMPGKGIAVVDTLAIAVGGRWGFAVRLNNDVRLSNVRLEGDSAAWAFAGGVLWIDAPRHAHSQLVLGYTLRDASAPPKDTASGAPADSTPSFGAYHNTDAWHPVFSYTSANDMATMSLTVRLPAAYQLATTLPQTAVVANGVRTVSGRSTYPAWLLSMIYDRDWKVATSDVDGVTIRNVHHAELRFLARHAGERAAAHRSRARQAASAVRRRRTSPLVEDRAIGPRGFSVRMTDAVVSGTQGESPGPRSASTDPVAAFAHEVSHGWTMNATGPAANMLREGWATFAEATVLGAGTAPAVETRLLNRLRNGYMLGSEGRLSILGNPDNGSVHYSKGVVDFSYVRLAARRQRVRSRHPRLRAAPDRRASRPAIVS